MTKRFWLRSVVTLAAVLGILAPVAAQAQIRQVSATEHKQAIGFDLGYFSLKSLDSRVEGDVLYNDLDGLLFEIKDFNGFTFGGEWLLTLGKYAEAGVNVGYYKHSVPSIYRDVTWPGGKEIEQELKLRIIPTTLTFRFLPVGHGPVEPYVGGGLGIFNWRYTESGEFVDFTDYTIFRETYEATGTSLGPVVLAGIRAPIGGVWDIGGEIRWQKATGDTKPEQSGLLGDKIDLGGWTTSFTMHLRF